MKQHGLFFILFAGLFLLYKFLRSKPIQWKDLVMSAGLLGAGVITPLAVTCLIFLKLGLFHKFWWWTWIYPRIYATQIPMAIALANLNAAAISAANNYGFLAVFWPLGLLSIMGLYSVLSSKNTERIVFTYGLTVFSIAALSVGFYFYPHYFLYAAPAAALSAALGANFIGASAFRFNRTPIAAYAGLAAIVVVFASAIYSERQYLFEDDPLSIARNTYGANPFPEAMEIGKYIEEHTKPDDKIIVFGSEPEIYFYAKRRAASGFIYTYEMMKDHPYASQFQTEMMTEVTQNKPKFLLAVNMEPSWFATPNDHRDWTILKRSVEYTGQYYQYAGLASMLWPAQAQTHIVWDTIQQPLLNNIYIAIYKRREGV